MHTISDDPAELMPGREKIRVRRTDEGQSLLDRAAHVTADRNKLAAELIQHANQHLAIAKDHQHEADEARHTAEILLGQKLEKAKPQGDNPEFVFKRRSVMSFAQLLAYIGAGITLIALGVLIGNHVGVGVVP